MTERIPTRIIETVDPAKPLRLTPAKAGGPIHTRSFTGRFRTLRLLFGGLLFVLFFGTAWLDWNGRQAVLWDLGARQFHVFGATFWPQDFTLLSALLIIAAFGLFFITVLAGRVWCGYACPQSTWTWVFMWAEKVTEGDRSQRLKLDQAPWSASKVLRRSAKHLLWLGVSLATAVAFVGYFIPIRDLAAGLLTFDLDLGPAVWVALFTAATYLNAGWLREQVCLHMCPYSRFQSVMFDADTLNVSYDAARGESRGPRRKDSNPQAEGLGDCVDCTLCVQVCPTGIDIREGLQYECIACAACIDACDSVMDKMNYPRGLVRYTTENALQGKGIRILRPRVFVYATILAVLVTGLVTSMVTRTPLILDVIRDRNTLYREIADDMIENSYTLKVINQDNDERSFAIDVRGVEGIELDGAGESVVVEGGGVLSLPVRVRVHRDIAYGIMNIEFIVSALDDDSVSVAEDSRFLGPTP